MKSTNMNSTMQSIWEIIWEILTMTTLSFPGKTPPIWRKKAKWGHSPEAFTVGKLETGSTTHLIPKLSDTLLPCNTALGVQPPPEQQLLCTSRAQCELPFRLMGLDTEWTFPLCNQLAKQLIHTTLREKPVSEQGDLTKRIDVDVSMMSPI